MAFLRCGGGMKYKEGTVTGHAAGDDTYVFCGFKPKKIFLYGMDSANMLFSLSYDEDMSSTYQVYGYKASSSSSGVYRVTISGNTTRGCLNAITSSGFYFNFGSLSTYRYVAIG